MVSNKKRTSTESLECLRLGPSHQSPHLWDKPVSSGNHTYMGVARQKGPPPGKGARLTADEFVNSKHQVIC